MIQIAFLIVNKKFTIQNFYYCVLSGRSLLGTTSNFQNSENHIVSYGPTLNKYFTVNISQKRVV
jgi:hypothetical protein